MNRSKVALIIAVAALITSQSVQAEEVGVLAAINRDVIGERPREQPRALVLNEKLILDERVATTELGGGQVMFLDQTTLTLSTNSDIVLDRYVYDPATRTGEIGMTMVVGAMRFVGGRITKSNEAVIRTPTATIGIRGGIGHITVGADGSTQYIHVAGSSSTVVNDNGSATVTRPGATIYVPAGLNTGISGDDIGRAGAVGSDETGTRQAGSAGDSELAPNGGAPQSGQLSDAEGINRDVEDEQTRRRRLERPLLQLDQALDRRRAETIRQALAEEQGFGRRGGPPRFTGIATPEAVEIAVNGDGGSGGGGARRSVTPETTRDGVDEIETRVSLADDAPRQPPVSTFGEQEEESLDTPPLNLGAPPLDVIADSNLGQTIANELNMIQDGLTIRSDWTALSGLSDGTFIRSTPGLAFELQYSLTAQEGLVSVELPDTGDIGAANLTLLGGEAIKGDQFIVTGDETLNLVGAGGRATLLGGDALNTDLQINADDRGEGVISIDYAASNLQNLSFVDGAITPAVGQRVVGGPVEAAIQSFESGQ